MHVRLKGLNSRKKRLADGSVKTYYWAWKGGPPLPGKPGSPEFVAAYNAAIAKKVAPPAGILLALLNRFQQSGEFLHAINERTRRDYVKNIKRIEREFADFPLKALDDREARAVFLEWRDELAKTSLRQADYTYQTLRRVLSWALKRGLIATNPCAEGGKLYHGTRVDKVWSDEEVGRFFDVAPPRLALALLLAINTGQRQGDLLKLPWSSYDGKTHPHPPAQDGRLCLGSCVRRTAQGSGRSATAEPADAGEHGRAAMDRKRLPERLAGDDDQGQNHGPDLSRSARHRGGEAGAGRLQCGRDLLDHRAQARRRAGDPHRPLSAAGRRGRG